VLEMEWNQTPLHHHHPNLLPHPHSSDHNQAAPINSEEHQSFLKSRLDLSSSAVALSRLYYINIYLNYSHLMMRSICLIKDCFFFLQEWIVSVVSSQEGEVPSHF
jgi:hypothetical protein